jgi:hypothetical protein
MDRTSDSEIALESNDRSDKLPLFDDVINKSSSSPLRTSLSGDHQSKTKPHLPFYVNNTIAEDPQALYDLIREQACLPPRPFLTIRGRKGFSTDLNFTIDLTLTVLRLKANDGEWNELKVVQDGDGVEAFRGGRCMSLEWEHASRLEGLRIERDSGNGDRELEDQSLLGMNGNRLDGEGSSLMAWCERFCRDPAGIKTFTLQRDLSGFDHESVRSEVAWYLRSIDYDGQIFVTFNIWNKSLKVYSPRCQWYRHVRESRSFEALMYIAQLWIVLSPLFTYLEGRYGVVRSVWRSSRTVKDTVAPSGVSRIFAHGRNEAQIVDLWSTAIAQAVKDRENSGRILRLEYLETLQERTQERMAHVGLFLPEQNTVGSSGSGTAQAGSSNLPWEVGENTNTAGSK